MKKWKECTNKLLELISEFIKVTGYWVNIETLIVFVYTSNKQFENKVKYHLQYYQGKKSIIL